MVTIRRGETASETFTIEQVIENPQAVQVTFRQGNYVVIQKQLEDLVYTILLDDFHVPYATQIDCTLSQEETFKFWANDDALVQVRIITSYGTSLVSDIARIKVDECLDCNILPLSDEEEHKEVIHNQNKTIHPLEEEQSITADEGYTGLGTVKIKGVTTENITAENIKAGTTIKVGDSSNTGRIKNVTGTFTSDANATASEILSGSSAYVNGEKIYGELTAPFVVTLQLNDSSGIWEPDVELADIMSAFTSGRNIITRIDDDTLMSQSNGTVTNLGHDRWVFEYVVQDVGGVHPDLSTTLTFYILDEYGISTEKIYSGDLEEVPPDA